MTERESQILQWIKEDPFISQQEIAERASITRSSVAVHISNLMKKGKIVGKGYVIQEDGYITVIGGANMDISGTSEAILMEEDSNPGTITATHGGVGRNIAENLKRLERQVEFITVLGDDVYGQEILRNCKMLGIGIQHSMIRQGDRTSTYLCINDSNGDMKLAVNDMRLYDCLNRTYLQTKLEVINRSDLLIIDANLSEEAILFLAKNCTVPILAEPVSTKKAKKLKPVLSYLDTIKPNRLEIEVLSGVKITNNETLSKAADILLEQGVKNIFISLGKDGIYYANKMKKKHLPCYPCNIVNTTGCGDSFMAAVAYGKQEGYSAEESAKLGLAASSICIETTGAISEEMCIKNIWKRVYENSK